MTTRFKWENTRKVKIENWGYSVGVTDLQLTLIDCFHQNEDTWCSWWINFDHCKCEKAINVIRWRKYIRTTTKKKLLNSAIHNAYVVTLGFIFFFIIYYTFSCTYCLVVFIPYSLWFIMKKVILLFKENFTVLLYLLEI